MTATLKAVFLHQGKAPRQFTPVSGAPQITAANAGWRTQLRFRGSRHRTGVAEFVGRHPRPQLQQSRKQETLKDDDGGPV